MMVDTLSGVAMGKLPDYETTYPTVAVACICTEYVLCTYNFCLYFAGYLKIRGSA